MAEMKNNAAATDRAITANEVIVPAAVVQLPAADVTSNAETLTKDQLKQLPTSALLDYVTSKFNLAYRTKEPANFSATSEALAILDSRELNDRDQFIANGYKIALSAIEDIVPTNCPAETLLEFKESPLFRDRHAEFSPDVQKVVNVGWLYTRNISDAAALKELEIDGASYQPSEMIEKIFKCEEISGRSPEILSRARIELGALVENITGKIRENEIVDPREIMATIHYELKDTYKMQYGSESSLANGLATHNLDCDTVAAVYYEVGKQLDLPIEMYRVEGSGDNSHVVSKWNGGKDSFYWEGLEEEASAAEQTKDQIRDGMARVLGQRGGEFEKIPEKDLVYLGYDPDRLATRVDKLQEQLDTAYAKHKDSVRAECKQIVDATLLLRKNEYCRLLSKVLDGEGSQADLDKALKSAKGFESLEKLVGIVGSVSQTNR